MRTDRFRGWLVGTSEAARRRVIALAVVALLAAFVGLSTYASVAGHVPNGTPFVLAASALVLGVTALFAHRGCGLLASLLLALAPFAAWVAVGFTAVESHPPGPEGLSLVATSVGTGAVFGIPLGLAGFAIGSGVRRIRDRDGRTPD